MRISEKRRENAVKKRTAESKSAGELGVDQAADGRGGSAEVARPAVGSESARGRLWLMPVNKLRGRKRSESNGAVAVAETHGGVAVGESGTDFVDSRRKAEERETPLSRELETELVALQSTSPRSELMVKGGAVDDVLDAVPEELGCERALGPKAAAVLDTLVDNETGVLPGDDLKAARGKRVSTAQKAVSDGAVEDALQRDAVQMVKGGRVASAVVDKLDNGGISKQRDEWRTTGKGRRKKAGVNDRDEAGDWANRAEERRSLLSGDLNLFNEAELGKRTLQVEGKYSRVPRNSESSGEQRNPSGKALGGENVDRSTRVLSRKADGGREKAGH